MDISKMPNDQKLHLCKWYFKAGFALLPFIWAVNVFWFYKEAFKTNNESSNTEYPEQKEIRKYVIYSGIGALIWTVFITTWIITFQLNRATWGEFADNISFIIPVGQP